MSKETKEETLKNFTGVKRTRSKAIRAYCLDCCGGSAKEVKLCTFYACDLYPYRLGEDSFNHREVSEDQREAARVRARENFGHGSLRMDTTDE